MLIIGNWKMHKTLREGVDFLETLAPRLAKSQATVWLAPPFTLMREMAVRALLPIGAQNMHFEEQGAFTGEISSTMLKDAGAQFVLLGHSERRHLFGESSSLISKKVDRALKEGLQPVLCVGETLEQRERGETKKILEEQLMESLDGIAQEHFPKIILAYEPVWAIGTGKVAHPDAVNETHAFCRSVLPAAPQAILYGGSVNLDNAAELTAQEEIDGLLVGGASLELELFLQIIQSIEGVTS